MPAVKHLFRFLLVATLIATIAGCAAVQTSIAKRKLDVQTRVSTAIFVDPVKRDKRVVYVDIRSAVMEFDRNAFRKAIVEEFAKNGNGYRITDDPDAAQYQMNIFVTKLEKASPTAAEVALKQGYMGDVGAGAMLGASMGADRGHSASSTVGGGILGAVATTAANAFVQDVTYLLVADVQIKEKTRKGVIVRKDTQISAKVSDAGTSTQRVSEATNRKEYRTRIVTTANKANLELEEAQPLMFAKTAYAMASFF
ncbi:MAG TPA: conjugal transfer protein TraT [Gammaproteobacteria bacterium]|nr:conjugal transfer protein TraT [Gammaproteobacteria bacterium]